jgi:hypothetical protein
MRWSLSASLKTAKNRGLVRTKCQRVPLEPMPPTPDGRSRARTIVVMGTLVPRSVYSSRYVFAYLRAPPSTVA